MLSGLYSESVNSGFDQNEEFMSHEEKSQKDLKQSEYSSITKNQVNLEEEGVNEINP